MAGERACAVVMETDFRLDRAYGEYEESGYGGGAPNPAFPLRGEVTSPSVRIVCEDEEAVGVRVSMLRFDCAVCIPGRVMV